MLLSCSTARGVDDYTRRLKTTPKEIERVPFDHRAPFRQRWRARFRKSTLKAAAAAEATIAVCISEGLPTLVPRSDDGFDFEVVAMLS